MAAYPALAVFSGAACGSLRVVLGIALRIACDAATLTPPGLRSVASVRTPLPLGDFAFPALLSLRPGGADVGFAALALRVGPARWNPATGLSHAATSMSPLLSDLSRLAASSRNSRDALRVRRLVAFGSPGFMLEPSAGGLVPRRWRTSCPPTKNGSLTAPVLSLTQTQCRVTWYLVSSKDTVTVTFGLRFRPETDASKRLADRSYLGHQDRVSA